MRTRIKTHTKEYSSEFVKLRRVESLNREMRFVNKNLTFNFK